MAKDKIYTRSTSLEANSSATTNQEVKMGSTTPLLFNDKNYKLIAAGLGLIFLGLLLMSGGHMPDNNTWDESLIYSFRRITLAPMVIIAGLVVEIYAVFYKK